MRKPTRRERKAQNSSYSAGYSLGYAEGYAKGLEDGNPFTVFIKALSNLAKTIAENPEFMKQAKELERKQEQDRLAKLYGNETHYAFIDEVPDTTEEANNNDDVNTVD
jgi:flagellar biosynthesis/type III secretory pathway protein FliH